MIKSFSGTLTRKVFLSEVLTKKERKSLGSLNLKKAVERLALLDVSNENHTKGDT